MMGSVSASGAPNGSRSHSEKRLSRCFRVFEVASEQHKTLAKTLKKGLIYLCKEAQHNGYIADEEIAFSS